MSRIAGTIFCAFALLSTTACGEDAFEPTSLTLQASADLKVGNAVKLIATGTDKDGKSEALTSGVTFSSSNEELATVDGAGVVTVLAGGPVTLTAKVGDLQASLEDRTSCDYPRFSPTFGYNKVFPALSWPAQWPNGEKFELNLADVHCDLEWKKTKTFVFVLSAGWCGPCTMYAKRLETMVAELNSLGMEIAIVEVQDVAGDPADLEFAYNHLRNIKDNFIPAIALGDADSQPENGFFQGLFNDRVFQAFPSVFVLRTSDMRVIADQKRADFYLPLEDIARNPDADWSKSGNPVFVNNCDPGDEESETNHTPQNALAIAPGEHKGGICKDAPDLYKIDVAGAWTLQLDFSHDVGDLDVFVWDAETNEPAMVGGKLIGSSNGTNTEKFEHSGPAIVGVAPYRAASAPYTLTLTEH